MSNTVIKLRKSSVSGIIPSDLEYGEIAINYADGLIYYKDSLGAIQHISSGANSFTTVNVAGTFLTAAVPSAILSIAAGQNIELTPDFVNDAFTITANLKVAYDVANAAYNAANAIGGGVDLSGIYNTANAAFDKANSANVLAYDTGIGANAYADVVGLSANNYAGFMANAANSYAASLTPDLSPAFNKANDAFGAANQAGVIANAAYNKANAANLLAYNTGIGSNNYTDTIGLAAFDHANSVGVSANIYTNTIASSVNAYVNLSTSSANNYAGAMANAANAYAASLSLDLSPAFNKANAAYTVANAAYDNANSILVVAQAAFDRANLSNDVLYIESAYDTANAAYDKANSANLLAYNTGIGANNYAGAMANAANAYAASLTPDLSPVFIVANNAYDKANLALPAFTTGNLTFSQTIPLVGPNLSNTAGERIVIWPQRPDGAYYNLSLIHI